MEGMAVIGVLIVLTLVGSIFFKSYIEKKRIERARKLVDLHDDLRRMQNAMGTIPEIYMDTPTKIFIIKRLMQLIDQVEEVGNESDSLSNLRQELESRLEKAMAAKDDSVKRLSQWSKINHPDAAHEVKNLCKYLHGQIISSVKGGLIPRAHGSRVVKNLKMMMHRIALDLNFNLASAALKSGKLRPALGKLRVAKGLVIKSPIKQHLNAQKEQIEKLIESTERRLSQQRKEQASTSVNKLASGVDKMEEEEAWDNKKNIYDSE